MAIRWRELLDQLQISWSERGHNVARGWISIRCPWCGSSDPSHHLSINENHGGYNCFRIASHSGKSPYWLLRGLGVRGDLRPLLEAFGGTDARQHLPIGGWKRDATPTGPYAKRWDSFTPASRDNRALDYLASRGVWNPGRTADRFDLRVGTNRYAARLWFPLTTQDGAVVGFTGRAMTDRQPRYLTETAEGTLYVPEWLSPEAQVTILVEGPMDALQLADATGPRYDFGVAALCGLAITPRKRLMLLSLARATPIFFVVLDSTVSAVDTNKLLKELQMLPPLQRLERLHLLPGIDDPGEMSRAEIEQWLGETGIAAMAQT